jgi:SAM-dependent methyltransferase
MAPGGETSSSGWRCIACGASTGSRVVLRGEHPLPGAPLRYALVECPSCGLHRIDPVPSPDQLAALYADGYSPYGEVLNDAASLSRKVKMAVGRLGALAERRRRGPVGVAARVAVTAAEVLSAHALPLTTRFPLSCAPGDAILDYGCGAGGWVRSMRNGGYSNLWAYDIAHPGLAALEREGIRVLTAPAALPEGTFDCVRLEHSLEHVTEPVAVMREVAAALKPGGSAVVAVPHIASRTARAMGAAWPTLTLPHHLSHFTIAALERVAARVGLRVAEVQRLPYWETGYAAARAADPGLPAVPARLWRMRYFLGARLEREGDCIAVRMQKDRDRGAA